MRHVLVPVLALMALGSASASAEMFGLDYKPCGDKPSTSEIVACVNAKTKIWDARLNEAYKGAQKRSNEGQRQPLIAAEQAWMKYRDANCGFYGAADGTIRQVMAAECVRSMTQDRALELEKAMKLGD